MEISFRTWDMDSRSWVTESYDLSELHRDQLEQLLTDLVDRHDYYYMMSDDHSVWRAGTAAFDRIKKVASFLPADVANQIWEAKFGDFSLFHPLVKVD